jgi:hypothetical protein
LLNLDVNGDGKLTREELMPKFPPPGHPEGATPPGAWGEAPPPEQPGEPLPAPPDNQ